MLLKLTCNKGYKIPDTTFAKDTEVIVYVLALHKDSGYYLNKFTTENRQLRSSNMYIFTFLKYRSCFGK